MSKKQKTRAKARPKKASPKKVSSTALARVPPKRVAIAVNDPDRLLDAAVGQLGDLAHTGGIGLAEVKLTKAEEKIIGRPIDRAAVMVLPDSGQVYLPHAHYTAWLNEAFGRTGWALAPAAKPMKVENLIIIPYILYVHRIPVAFAHGGAEYHPTNKRQTYDDVLESTVAFGLRRCCKRFGMALELWDRRFRDEFIEMECVQVPTGRGKMWRRKNDPPFYDETKKAAPSKGAVKVGEVVERPAGNDGSGNEKITAEQVRRLVGMWRNAGRADADVQLWLKRTYGYTATKDIKRFDYNAIERALLAPGALRIPGDGE